MTVQPDAALRWETFLIVSSLEAYQEYLLCADSIYGSYFDGLIGFGFVADTRILYEEFRCGTKEIVGCKPRTRSANCHIVYRARRIAA